ncbi:MAG: CPBP family intramembrane glutamic endopeptidase [Pseudomonadota bacterium]
MTAPQPFESAALQSPARTARLWTEFLALFLGVPVLMLFTAGQFPLFPVLAMLLALSLFLLARTPGFRWRELLEGDLRGWIVFAAVYALITLVTTTILVLWLVPGSFLGFATHATKRWLMVMVLYPFVSALPQEIIFRTLFFRRYGALFPTPALLIGANGLAFGIGHLFYQNPVAIGLTTFSGFVIGYAYWRSGSLMLAFVLHAIGGMTIFTIGLGRFFYHGAIPS